MKVPHVEVLAKHSGPESCGGYGNIAAEALTGESVGGTLSSEITAFRVPTLLPDGEGHVSYSVIASYGRTWRSLSTLACVEAFCTGIGRPVNFPVFKNWNGRIQLRKISWCVGWRPFSTQAKNTKPGRKYRVGWGRSKSVRPPQNVSRESDNNIVPEKQANNVVANMSLRRSLWRKGR
jgi:hypothetical protein